MKIRLYENLRTVSYSPFYLADARRLYAAQGLTVETVPSPRPEETALGLIEGRVDVSWGGPMRVLLHHDRDPACPLVCFGQVVGRDPFMLLGRQPKPDFRFADLMPLEVGVVSEVPTPWMLLQDDLGRAGFDPAQLSRGPDATMAENIDALARGDLDVVQVMEPHASAALASGRAHLWHRASVRGDLAFTTFYAPRAFLDSQPEACAALVRTLATAVAEMYRTPADALAVELAPWFPTTDPGHLALALSGYQAAAVWTRDPSIAVAHLVKLKAALLSGGLIGRDIPYDCVVDDRFAG